MNDTRIASKTKAQLAHFMGKVFTHFSKPSKKGGPGSVPAIQLLPGFTELFDTDDG